MKAKSGYHAGEVRVIEPVEWTTERKGYLTYVTGVFMTDQFERVTFERQVPAVDSAVADALYEMLSHREIHYPGE